MKHAVTLLCITSLLAGCSELTGETEAAVAPTEEQDAAAEPALTSCADDDATVTALVGPFPEEPLSPPGFNSMTDTYRAGLEARERWKVDLWDARADLAAQAVVADERWDELADATNTIARVTREGYAELHDRNRTRRSGDNLGTVLSDSARQAVNLALTEREGQCRRVEVLYGDE